MRHFAFLQHFSRRLESNLGARFMKSMKSFFIILVALTITILFQNCSAPLASDNSTLSSSSVSSTSIQVASYPSSQQIALGQALTMSVSAYSTTGATLSYQWYKGGLLISGATASSYYVASATASDAATYYVRISDGTNTVTTGSFSIQIGTSASTISIASGPVAQTVAPGTITRFEVIASDSLGAALSYQWLKNGTAISGQNGSEMYIQSTTSADAGYYSAVVSNGTTTVRTNTVLLTVVATSASCANLGGTLYANHCYIVNRSAQTWANAQATCKSAGGNLATITTAAENYFVYTLTQTAVWLGASDTASEGNFVLVDGTAMSFSAWSSGEPNGGTSENCVQMTPTGYWNDLSCTEARAFVCEI